MPSISFTLGGNQIACELARKAPLSLTTKYGHAEKRGRSLMKAKEMDAALLCYFRELSYGGK